MDMNMNASTDVNVNMEKDTQYVPNKLLQNLKNPIFKENSIDPITGKYVKSIYARKVSKMGREIWTQVWQYYRDRKRTNIDSCYTKYYYTPVKVTYSGDPKIYYYLNKQIIVKPNKPDADLEVQYHQKKDEHKLERKNLVALEREMKKVVQREEQKRQLLEKEIQDKPTIPKIPKRNPDKYSKEGRQRIKEKQKENIEKYGTKYVPYKYKNANNYKE